jgi:hypothetical protein
MVPRDINEDARALMKAERYRNSFECIDKASLPLLLRRYG